MATLRLTSLEYREGNSDKLYNVSLEQEGGAYVVYAEYGRRGSVLKKIEKSRSYHEYIVISDYNELIAEKRAKGYRDRGITTTATTKTKTKPKPKAVSQLEQNIADGVRRIDFEL